MRNKGNRPRQGANITRRDFARRAALAAASITVLPGEVLAGPTLLTPAGVAESNLSADEPKLSPAAQAEAKAMAEAVLRKRGDRLSEEQKKEIRRLATEAQPSLEKLRAFALDNSDQPATVLKLYPEASARKRSKASQSTEKAS
jgi:hypothetical protein